MIVSLLVALLNCFCFTLSMQHRARDRLLEMHGKDDDKIDWTFTPEEIEANTRTNFMSPSKPSEPRRHRKTHGKLGF